MIIVQNDPRVPAGIFGDFLQDAGICPRVLRLFAGDRLPPIDGVSAAIVLGGYMGVGDDADYPHLLQLRNFIREAAEADMPLLGICLGGQLLADAFGGKVTANQQGERGMRGVRLTAEGEKDPLLAGIPQQFDAFQWHNDSFEVPAGAVHLAASEHCPGQAFRVRNAYGLQFHPEVNAEIVAAWNARSAPGEDYVSGFREAESAWHHLSLRLLANFLKLAHLHCV
jgi:GMP synthase (glutamine-hydrolysing)